MRLHEAKKLQGDVKQKAMVNDLVCRSLAMVTQAHVWHLQTKSFASHKALNDYYEFMQDKADELAEQFMGLGGTITFNQQNIKNFVSKEDTAAQLENFRTTCSKVEIELMKDENDQFHGIGDTALDIVKETDKVLYLLTLE